MLPACCSSSRLGQELGWSQRSIARSIPNRTISALNVPAGRRRATSGPTRLPASIPNASGAAADIDHAVAAARRSFEAGVWRDAEPQHKKKVLLRFAELIREHTDEIASTIPVAREDIPRLLSTGEGEGSHLRALFGDVDLHTLLHLATLFDIDARSRLRARSEHSRRR